MLVKRWQRWRFRTRRLQRWQSECYPRLERILATCGIHREVGITQHEFAQLAASKLKHFEEGSFFAKHTQQITEAFYRVQFGGQSLSKVEQQEIYDMLKQLEGRLVRP